MHGAFTFKEEIQNPPPVRLGQCLEDHWLSIPNQLYSCQVIYGGRVGRV
jgi:hypothetical protein